MDIFNSFLVKTKIAHRGLHNEDNPESSLGAFKNAVEKGYAIECDLRLIDDGTIVVFHDSTLGRMTGKDGYVKKLKKEDLKNYNIKKTKWHIPTLQELLEVVNGKVGILFEFKNYNPYNHDLEKAFLEQIKGYKGDFAVQSYNPMVVKWFKENAVNIPRGVLSSFFKDERMGWLKKILIKKMRFNKKCEPNFITYNFKYLPNKYVAKYEHLPILAFTIKSQNDYIQVKKFCDNIIFEGENLFSTPKNN